MGMLASVYRTVQTQHADGTATMQDCTNNGWSSRFNTVCVVNVEGPFEPNDSQPAVMLLDGPGFNPNPIIVSVSDFDAGKHTMFGGNFVYSSDTRFSEAVRKITGPLAGVGIRVHDRIER